MRAVIILLFFCLLANYASAQKRDIGAVTTAFQLLGPNHRIVVSAFDDPKINISWPLNPTNLYEKDKSHAYINEEFEGV